MSKWSDKLFERAATVENRRAEVLAEARWWVEAVRSGLTTSTGDKRNDGFIDGMRAMTVQQAPTDAELERFGCTLANVLEAAEQLQMACGCYCDYGADLVLGYAVDQSGCPAIGALLPLKTGTRTEPGLLFVRAGYGSRERCCWAAHDAAVVRSAALIMGLVRDLCDMAQAVEHDPPLAALLSKTANHIAGLMGQPDAPALVPEAPDHRGTPEYLKGEVDALAAALSLSSVTR